MGADVSRARFDALKDFAGVELQQGRVLLDGDFNELVDVLDRRLRAAAADLGSPGPATGIAGVAVVPRTTPDGFRVSAAGGKLSIGAGRMYVDGLLVENHGATPTGFDPLLAEQVGADPLPFDRQPYQPIPDQVPQAGTYLAYLDVWQREVTPLQDPDLIEPALGVDTTTRVQNAWQVKLFGGQGLPAGADCSTPDEKIPGWSDLVAPSAGRLTTGTVPVDDDDDPCYLPPTGGYRGSENQNYRVQIFDSGPLGKATFVWSRDNASVSVAVTEVVSPTVVKLATFGRDAVLEIRRGDWVEFVDDHREFARRSGELRKVDDIDVAGRTLTLAGALPADLIPPAGGTDTAASRHLRAVRWDQARTVVRADGTPLADLDAPGSAGTITVPSDGTQIVLESGVGVTFSADPTGGTLRAGDYWEFAARTADTSVEQLAAAPPRGVHHHYARLGYVTLPGAATDCRTLWPPAGGDADGDCCSECTVCVTPDSHASGAMTLQAAVDLVTRTGGVVCVKSGIYRLAEPVAIRSATALRVRGEGVRTVLLAEQGAFVLIGCVGCTLEELTVLESGAAPAIALVATADVVLQRLVVLALGVASRIQLAEQPSRGGTGIVIAGLNAMLTIRENVVVGQVGIAGASLPAGVVGNVHAAVFLEGPRELPVLAVRLLIEDNLLVCALAGIDLSKSVIHALGTGIAGNDILGCRQWAVVATGVSLLDGWLRVAGNTIGVGGHGVVASTANSRVVDNDIAAGRIAALIAGSDNDQDGATGASGIYLTTSTPFAQLGSCVVEGNTVTNTSGPAIVGAGRARGARIDRNVLRQSMSGVVLALLGATVSITGNQLTDLVAPRDGGLVGLGAVLASSVLIGDNLVDGLAPVDERAAARLGIRVLACLDVQVLGNQVRRAMGQGDNSQAIGIDIAGPFVTATVAHNTVRPDAPGSTRLPGLLWTAVRINGRAAPVVGPVAAGLPDATAPTFAVVATSTPTVSLQMVGAAAAVVDVGTRGGKVLVDGNVLFGGSARLPALLVRTAGDALVSTNQVEHDPDQDGSNAAVAVRGGTIVVQGNRVLGGRPSVELVPESPRGLTVLGNITSSPITVRLVGQPENPLGSPWDVLNVQA